MEIFTSEILASIGIIAFLVSVITQLTKNIGFLAKISTTLQVIVLSIILSVTYCFVSAAVAGTEVIWYSVIFAIIYGFISAFIATYGWDELNKIWQKYKKSVEDADDGTKG